MFLFIIIHIKYFAHNIPCSFSWFLLCIILSLWAQNCSIEWKKLSDFLLAYFHFFFSWVIYLEGIATSKKEIGAQGYKTHSSHLSSVANLQQVSQVTSLSHWTCVSTSSGWGICTRWSLIHSFTPSFSP